MLALFKGFVHKNRPSLDIDKVATGETWIGPDALANGLVDGLITVDELLTDEVDQGAEVDGPAASSPPTCLASPRLASLPTLRDLPA